MSSQSVVDWPLAVRIGSRLSGANPEVGPGEAAAIVAELRAGAHRSTELVREFTGLSAPADTAPVLVVDRPGWIQANADSFATLLSPLTEKMAAKAAGTGDGSAKPASGLTQAIGSRVTGGEVGVVLGLLSSRVLGQFDPFHDPAGRLLLVAPNIVKVERELKADPTDFRLWVCLHEETHRVQFTAVPWMREHLFGLVEQVLSSVEPQAIMDQIKRAASDSSDTSDSTDAADSRGRGTAGSDLQAPALSLLERVSTPEQRAVLDQVTGVMSLLEGHADVVMDGVGPSVIPSVASIRASFTTRRRGVGVLDKVLRRVLGMEAKMAQYRDGAAFVRHIVEKVGMEEFNVIWAEPAHLPTKAEITAPDAWISRVL